MTAEQQYDLIAEANWQLCVHGEITIPGFRTFWSFGSCKHDLDGETDLGRGHYDTHNGSAMIPVRECFRVDDKYVYQKRKWPK